MSAMNVSRDASERAATRCANARRRVIAMSYAANSAHLGSSLSAIEILDAVMRACDVAPENARATLRDRIVFSKGHAAMAYYATLEQHGLVAPQLLDAYLKNDTPLWGHVTRAPQVPAIDASTGSLGHGLSLAVGYALGHKLKGREDLK
ncbi:MAG: transketolase, partial [Methylocystis sp.]|nr:transketolase [Methylocystis sp.]